MKRNHIKSKIDDKLESYIDSLPDGCDCDDEKRLGILSKLHQYRIDELEEKNKRNEIIAKAAGGIGSTVVASYWMAKGLKFEETGAFTSRALNWVFGNIKNFKIK